MHAQMIKMKWFDIRPGI